MGYADDTSVYKSYPADIAAKESATVKGLKVDIELTKKWMAENRLKMNDTKTEYIYLERMYNWPNVIIKVYELVRKPYLSQI